MEKRRLVSAGLVVYRRRNGVEVLLAHPGGPFWAGKDAGAWTIPKGLVEGSDLLAEACREFSEETGLTVSGPFVPLAPVRQTGDKIVHAFAVEADLDLGSFSSNTFEMEWPPGSGRRQTFPEIDRIAYFDLATAAKKILPAQRPLLRQLAEKVAAPNAR